MLGDKVNPEYLKMFPMQLLQPKAVEPIVSDECLHTRALSRWCGSEAKFRDKKHFYSNIAVSSPASDCTSGKKSVIKAQYEGNIWNNVRYQTCKRMCFFHICKWSSSFSHQNFQDTFWLLSRKNPRTSSIALDPEILSTMNLAHNYFV